MSAPSEIRVAKHGGNPILKFIGRVSALCGVAAAGMIFSAVLITCEMIFERFVLNRSTVWQTEVVIYLMIAATLIGLPYVQRVRGHVNVDLLPMMLPFKLRKALAVVTLSASIVVMAVIMLYGYELWEISWSRNWTSDTVWGAKLWVPYLAIPVGLGLFTLQLMADLAALIMGLEAPFSIETSSDAEAGGRPGAETGLGAAVRLREDA